MAKKKIDRSKALAMKRDGRTAEEIAQALDCSASSVYRILRNEGEALSPDGAKIKELYEQGLTQREVATQLGVSPTTVGKYVRAEDASRAHGPRPLSEGRIKAILDLDEQGFTRTEIAARVGVAYATVHKYLKK